ncbi:MAG TPA: hypothetical protein VHM00_06705 [Caldimonas sp.]|jgi:hypothetical protein|nr:hypothetical protein [Caldimonas sp.]HEX2540757.1 hypothetical protein [Caldimonas sp.]
MRQESSTLHFSPAFRSPSPSGAIEWEELPSLAGRIRAASDGPSSAGVPWDATRPADFDPSPPSQPFREPLNGVAIREVLEPDVFRHFFGR